MKNGCSQSLPFIADLIDFIIVFLVNHNARRPIPIYEPTSRKDSGIKISTEFALPYAPPLSGSRRWFNQSH